MRCTADTSHSQTAALASNNGNLPSICMLGSAKSKARCSSGRTPSYFSREDQGICADPWLLGGSIPRGRQPRELRAATLSALRRLGRRPRESAIPAHHIHMALPTAVTLRRVCYKTSTEIILFSCRNARIEMQGKSSKTAAAGFVEAKPALLTEQGPPHGGNPARNHPSAGMLAKKLV